MDGFIAIHRQIKENFIWKDKPFSKGQAWIDILLRVNHKPNEVLIGNQVIKLQKGETVWSILDMSKSWGWSRKKVENFLNVLEKEQMLYNKRTTKYTVLTVAKWEAYQNVNVEKINKRTSSEHQKSTNNNDNNDNKKHIDVFDHYLKLDLIKHRTLTEPMKKAMDKATKELNCDFDYLITLLDRHKVDVENTKGNTYPVKPRSIDEFFGQKIHNGTSLICSKYDYKDEKPKTNIDTSTLGERVIMWND